MRGETFVDFSGRQARRTLARAFAGIQSKSPYRTVGAHVLNRGGRRVESPVDRLLAAVRFAG